MNEILKYQDLDLEVQKLESDIKENADRKNAIKMQQYLKDYQSKIVELNKKAKALRESFNKYKEVERVVVEHEDPKVILDRITKLEEEIQASLTNLNTLI